jgi:hypothetical protein
MFFWTDEVLLNCPLSCCNLPVICLTMCWYSYCLNYCDVFSVQLCVGSGAWPSCPRNQTPSKLDSWEHYQPAQANKHSLLGNCPVGKNDQTTCCCNCWACSCLPWLGWSMQAGNVQANKYDCYEGGRLWSLRLPALMDLYIYPLYVLVSKILSSILNSLAHIHPLYHPLSTLSTMGPTCHFI